ncbi:MAG: hypothetical protein IKT93_03270 [Clostridia bacterium]|nr:hypothetical protein [Clostridia bacterium]
MSNKVFNKKLPHRCEYCIHGIGSQYSDEILCIKRGITAAGDSCRKYKYDPLKRQPLRQKIADNYSPEDFSV